MAEYRTGNHWGVTIVKVGSQPPAADGTHADDHLVAVVLHDDAALAERICALLNADDARIWGRTLRCSCGNRQPADSCTCDKHKPDPACPVHHGRRARGPKPPPVGPGCTCDGSGRTCPRHGAVI